MLKTREKPYVWVTWITKVLAGECSCEWAAWFKAHHLNYDRAPDNFDSVGWQMKHAELVRTTRANLVHDGYTVTTESQNAFTLKGKVGDLAGKPDLIACKGRSGFVIDTKTGQPKASDRIQVMLYMWAIPKVLPQFKDFVFDGKVIYQAREVMVLASEADALFVTLLRNVMWRICDSNPAHKIPSGAECRFCHIAQSHCPERIDEEEGDGASASTSDF